MAERKERKCELLVIGGSSGSLSMVMKIIPHLRKDNKLAVIIIFHHKESDQTVLIEILTSRTSYTVKEIDEKEKVLPGTIYLAPADYHILIEKDRTMALDVSEKVNYSRPSIDVTFESASDVYGSSLTCMLLSGANSDGVNGLIAAKKTGATIIVQDPATAEIPFMPQQAVDRVAYDLLLTESNLEDLIQSI